MFVTEGSCIVREISSMPGQFHYSTDTISSAIPPLLDCGVDKILLFGLPEHKDALGSQAYSADGIVPRTIRELKSRFPQLMIVADVCLCEYTSHGHCGVVTEHGEIDNDSTLTLLAKSAVLLAESGADIIAPSDMMDGRVEAIRSALDLAGSENTPIMSYSVKYASAFYGPFRAAVDSAPQFGDRKTYQMDYRNIREAVKEALLDTAEGADILMVKPALSYLDVIATVKSQTLLPLAAYSVSGEYSMVKAAAAAGYIDEYTVMLESAAAIYRAGADILISYFSPQIAAAIAKGDL